MGINWGCGCLGDRHDPSHLNHHGGPHCGGWYQYTNKCPRLKCLYRGGSRDQHWWGHEEDILPHRDNYEWHTTIHECELYKSHILCQDNSATRGGRRRAQYDGSRMWWG